METTKYLRKRAKDGDPDAAFRVGYRLAFHRNPWLRNRNAAKKYWLQAATQGHIVELLCLAPRTCSNLRIRLATTPVSIMTLNSLK